MQLNTYIQNEDGSYHSTELTDAISLGNAGTSEAAALTTRLGSINLWSEMLSGTDGELISKLLYDQYDLVSGQWPEAANEVVLILDENNEITDIAFYALGLMTDDEVNDILRSVMKNEKIEAAEKKITYDDILGTTFKLVLNNEFYNKNADSIWEDMRDDDASMTEDTEPANAQKAEKFKEYAASLNAAQKTDLYTQILSAPTPEYLEQTVEGFLQQYPTIAQIKADAGGTDDLFDTQGYAAVAAAFDQMMETATNEAVLAGYYDNYMPSAVSGSTLAETLLTIGSINYDTPAVINIYATTFEDKETIDGLISDYNASMKEDDQITYTDYVGMLMSGVTTMIDAVSYGLIGFVSISLIVSSIMIGIITYISVLERTKEIGILRSVGASKRDISRVFNAETIIVGFAAGLIGIGITILLNILISITAENLTGISGIAILPPAAGVILVAVSVLLTMTAGLVPSKMAAKKDPVIALRTE